MARMVRMADASMPGKEKVMAGCQIIAGYIGGDTPHVWTEEDWHRPEFTGFKKLPIFVRSNAVGSVGGKADGFTALEALFTLGVPIGSAVVYDRETNEDAEGSAAFDEVLNWVGYHPIQYGSMDNIFKHPSPWFPADPTGTPHIVDRNGVEMTQYIDDQGGYDYSEVKFWVVERRLKVW